jgi:hypothetical protein
MRSQSSVAVWDIDGNSSAQMAPAALSPCQRPSAAARTASRSPYVSAQCFRAAPRLRQGVRARYGFQSIDEAADAEVITLRAWAPLASTFREEPGVVSWC